MAMITFGVELLVVLAVLAAAVAGIVALVRFSRPKAGMYPYDHPGYQDPPAGQGDPSTRPL